jgi:menaquinone-specific isochorismate synthase
VVDDIARVLNQVCRRWRKNDNNGAGSLLKLARVQHLVTRLEGELSEGQTDSSVLAKLHPTSAVGGVPNAVALPLIRRLEPFDRGWYGGPVGWIGSDGAELAVGIRSGLVEGRCLHLYSGAGVVPGSTSDGEWAEIESKLANFLAALG